MPKRFLDIFICLISILFFWPILLILALLIRLILGSPVYFKQMRPGKDGIPFLLYKFRTMKDSYDQDGNLLPDEYRISSFGRFLRSTSLDELPELWNVLKGEMSIVGPRPLLMQYLERYNPEQMRRHLVKPGITGWAQVNGRNAITWDAKFEMDTWYIDNISLLLDIKIIGMTIIKILKREGINQPGHATIEEFNPTAGASDGERSI